MCDAIRVLAAKYGSTFALQGIGIGVPGIIDMQTGMLRESPNLPGWAETPVRAEIERLLGTRVILENDANVAALGEKWLGAARDVDDMAMLTLGTGVGGGIVLRGRIWHGMTGMAGEFGHMTVEPEDLHAVAVTADASNSTPRPRPSFEWRRRRLHLDARLVWPRPPAQIRNSAPKRSITWPFRETRKRRKFLAEWDALWAFAWQPGQRIQSQYVCDWWRSVERMGGIFPLHL